MGKTLNLMRSFSMHRTRNSGLQMNLTEDITFPPSFFSSKTEALGSHYDHLAPKFLTIPPS